MGPDGFLGRRPEAIELCREVGLADALVPIGARGASVWARGRLRALPEGHAMGIPTRFWPTARSGVLGVRGLVGLARDAVLPRPDVRGPIGDRSVGPLVARKLGHQVVDVLVDPLIGGIHAGSVDDMSAAATFPPLLAAAQRRGGLMRALRAEVPPPDPDGPPLFWSLEGGMASLVDALGSSLRQRGVDVRLSAPAEPARTGRRRVERLVRRPDGRGRRRRAGHARPRHRHPLASPRRRGGGPAPDDRLRLGRAGHVLRPGRRRPDAPARHRFPGASAQPPQGARRRGR